MKVIGRNWKAVLSVLLLLVAVLVYVLGYRPRSEAYVMERDQLNAQITALQTTIVENEMYKDVQAQLEPAEAAIEESRAALYENFPADMKEEDQILYLLYLEKTLGTGSKELGYTQKLHDIFLQRFGSGGDIEFSFGEITPMQAVSTALASTVGTGNIAGVTGAIILGGPGAVFWMWVSALFGMVTKFSEVTLAVKYRERNEKGDWCGGPM